MQILVACEESQAVAIALRQRGHDAYSCDIIPCSGGHPEWHIQQDVLPLLDGYAFFYTCDGAPHYILGRWDMIIAFPPCTHLCSAGQSWFTRGVKDPQLREDAAYFFMRFICANCQRIAVENPVGIMSTKYRKPDCIIQPWQFGHPESKTTCLWLKGLPRLVPTNILERPKEGWKNQSFTASGRYAGFVNYDENGKILAWNDPKTARIRSKTYLGIAAAMADQWAGSILQEEA